MITKTFFINVLNRLKEITDAENELDTLLRKKEFGSISDFFNSSIIYNPELISMLVDALDQGTSPGDDWVSWWVYCTNFGRGGKFYGDPVITFENEVWVLDSPDKLYDFIKEKC